MGIWDDNAFVVDCIQGGVHKSNLRNLAGNGFQLNEIAALEGLADEDLKPAGKLGDAVLQADAGRHAGRAQGRDEGAEVDAQRRKSGEDNAEFDHQLHYVADKRVDGRINAFLPSGLL